MPSYNGVLLPGAFKVNPQLFSPIAHWLLDGALVDAVGAKTLSTIAGVVGYGRGLDNRKAAQFNGGTLLAFTGDNTEFLIDDITVALWFYGRTDAYLTLFAIDSPTSVSASDNAPLILTQMANLTPPNYIRASSQSGSLVTANKDSGVGATPNQWHHIIIARASGVYSGYLDGEPMWPTPPASVATPTPGANSQIALGGLRDGTYYHHGMLQSVMVWGSALTDSQQRKIVNAVGMAL